MNQATYIDIKKKILKKNLPIVVTFGGVYLFDWATKTVKKTSSCLVEWVLALILLHPYLP